MTNVSGDFDILESHEAAMAMLEKAGIYVVVVSITLMKVLLLLRHVQQYGNSVLIAKGPSCPKPEWH